LYQINHNLNNMKKLLFFAAISMLIISCNSGNSEKTSSDVKTKVVNTDIENLDSLATDPNSVWKNTKTIVEGVAHSGKFSSKIDSLTEFSLVFEQRLGDINSSLPKTLNFQAYALALKPDTKVLMVVSVNNNKYYKTATMDTLFTTLNQWKEIKASFELPDALNQDDILKAYVWNQKKGELIIDDYNLEFNF